jgi:hypothetical protein
VRRLHGLLDHAQQVLTQLSQVHILPQRRREVLQRARRVVLAAIEAPVNYPLDAPRRGVKSAAMRSVESTMTTGFSWLWPVMARVTCCMPMTMPK